MDKRAHVSLRFAPPDRGVRRGLRRRLHTSNEAK
jgi:hypothetical protein